MLLLALITAPFSNLLLFIFKIYYYFVALFIVIIYNDPIANVYSYLKRTS